MIEIEENENKFTHLVIVDLLTTADVPNRNGHVYTRQAIEDFLQKQNKQYFVYDELKKDDKLPIDNSIIGIASNFKMNGDRVQCDIKFDNELHAQPQIYSCYYGTLRDDVVSDISLNHLYQLKEEK